MYKPDMVCLSATIINDRTKFHKDVNKIYTASKTAGAVLILGGSAANKYVNVKGICDASILSVAELLNYTKEMFSV